MGRYQRAFHGSTKNEAVGLRVRRSRLTNTARVWGRRGSVGRMRLERRLQDSSIRNVEKFRRQPEWGAEPTLLRRTVDIGFQGRADA